MNRSYQYSFIHTFHFLTFTFIYWLTLLCYYKVFYQNDNNQINQKTGINQTFESLCLKSKDKGKER